jgi:hypothetical protein
MIDSKTDDDTASDLLRASIGGFVGTEQDIGEFL